MDENDIDNNEMNENNENKTNENTDNQFEPQKSNLSDKMIFRNVEDEMKKSFINYAMSVIVARALPDVRDGLKPVHRRILYSMSELNLEPNKAYKKCARIIGDTMGKYHPHGDSSIYDALVRMAQDFSMRYVLVDGHGNFGSIDGFAAAAPRYTEARMSWQAMEMLQDIEKDTVNFIPNYDEEFMEPTVLPARYPNLLVNGSSGIAVGMATNIPPHNLTEAIDAVVKIIDNYIDEERETELDEVMSIIKAPDYPTGGTILGTSGIKEAYRTGRGKVTLRSECIIEAADNSNGNHDRIVVTEIPYQVNKSTLIEKIADLVKEKRIEGIYDLRDETDRNGLRIVIEIKKDANANIILNQLYKFSQLQESYGITLLALVDEEPRVLNLLQILTEYLKHQKEVVTRRTQFDLNKALKRAHILEGFLIALDFIDEVIAIIRSNREIAVSKQQLMDRFELTQEQTDAIVEMRLRALSGMEKERLEDELNRLRIAIKGWQAILADEKLLYNVIKKEILAIRDKFGDERRSKIQLVDNEINILDLIENEPNVITLSDCDYVKRITLDTYKSQNRGGKGIKGMTTREEDFVKKLFIANTHDDILYFTSLGRVYKTKAYEIPEAGRNARGTAIINMLTLEPGEKIAAVIGLPNLTEVDEEQSGYITMITKKGIIKKTREKAFSKIRNKGLIAININEDDELIKVIKASDDDKIFIASHDGMGICFEIEKIRSVGRTAIGVKAMKLKPDDYIIGAELMSDDNKMLIVSENGFGKCTTSENFRVQGRNGKGLRIYKTTDKTGLVAGIASVNDKEELMIITSEGIIIRLRIGDISTTGRITQGVKLINLDETVSVISIAKIDEDHISDEEIELTDLEDNVEANEERSNEEKSNEEKSNEENSNEVTE